VTTRSIIGAHALTGRFRQGAISPAHTQVVMYVAAFPQLASCEEGNFTMNAEVLARSRK
jgi:hypothetical protein